MPVVAVDEIIDRAMVTLTLEFPIFAELIIRIGYKVVNDKNKKFCAWTDGTAIYINKAAIEYFNTDPIKTLADGREVNTTITKREMMFIICHELMHLLNQTYVRGINLGIPRYSTSPKDHQKNDLWNQATDYEINSILHHNESTQTHQSLPVGKMPEFVLYKSEYRNMTAEQIYQKLMDEQKDQNNPPPKFGLNGDGSGQGDNGLDFGLDEHQPIADDTVQSEVTTKIGEVMSKHKGQGDAGSALERALELGFKPQPFNWRRALTKYIRSYIRDNYTWNKPSRAGIANNVILPSCSRQPKIHVACAIDTSGSIGDRELKCMLNHLFTILTQFKSFQVDVWCCSTEVHENTFMTITEKNVTDLERFKIESTGGTDLKHNFPFLERKYKGKKPDVFMLLSDFYDDMNGDTTMTCPLNCVWMVMDNPDFVPPSKIKAVTYPFSIADVDSNE